MWPAKLDLREYLLDTGIWRALSKEDTQLLAQHSDRLRLAATAVVLFELVSGIPPADDRELSGEFFKRRAALRRLLKLVPRERIDLRLPHQVRLNAFGVSVSPAGLDFLILVRMFSEAETPDEFYRLISKARSFSETMPTLDWLREQGQSVSTNFKAAVAQGISLLRQRTEASLVGSGIVDRDLRTLRRSCVSYLHEVGDLKMYVLLAVASAAGVSRSPPSSGLWDWAVSEYDRLWRLYNGSIDVYLDAYEKYIEIAWNGENAGRNDSFDLDHLVYLRPSDNLQIFVTEDRRLRELATRSLPNRIVDLVGFRREIDRCLL